ncbi:MAG: ion transporter [Hyphomicrobiales bacterium]|nr:ion transporter [Hyphomicrobiales bacterium]
MDRKLGGTARIKRRIYDVLEDGGVQDTTSAVVNGFLVGLIVVNVFLVILETVPSLESRYWRLFEVLDVISVAIFTVEYLMRLWVADEHAPVRRYGPLMARLRYAVQPSAIVDLLAIAPSYLVFFGVGADLRFLRLFRLVRFLKLTRYSPGIRSLVNAVVTERHALIGSLVIMAGLIITAATALYLIEREIQPDGFGSIPAAMWWALATLTTVGYGDVVPMTVAGKIIGGVVMVFGLGMFAVPIGIIATAFAHEIHQREFVVTWAMVARVPLFRGLTAPEIAEVMKLLHAQTFQEGAVITHAGDPAHSMYFIASGSVRLLLPKEAIEMEEGMFFGELAILRQSQRSATVVASRRCQLLVLNASDLQALFLRRPGIAKHIRSAAEQRLGEEVITPGGDMASQELSQDVDGKADD